MPLNYRKNSITCSTEYYPNTSDLNGPSICQNVKINLQVSGQTNYVGLVASGHEQASDLTVNTGGQNLKVAKYSKATDNSIYAWGSNGGQLGINSNTSCQVTPTLICGIYFKCIFNNNASSSFSMGISNDNRLYSWGSNTYGQLGDNSSVSNRTQPVLVCSSCCFCYVSIGGTIQSSVLAISTTNKLFAWGYNSTNLLGDGTSTGKCLPVAICPSLNFCWVGIAGDIAYGLTTDGKLYGWGSNSSVCGTGILGDGGTGVRATPCLISGVNTVSKFYSNLNINNFLISNFYITNTGRLFGWGSNGLGTVGNCSASQYIYTPSAVCSLCSFCEILVNNFSSYGITTDNKFFTWGSNASSKLGINSITGTCSPTLVFGTYNFSKIVVGTCSVWALNSDNNLYAWGDNTVGQLGINSLTCACIPTQVCGGKYTYLPSFDNCRLSCALSNTTMIAIREDKKLASWGCNCCGILGNGNLTNSCIPSLVCCNYEYSYVTLSKCSLFALGLSNGSIYSWGNNLNGYLGDNTVIDKCQPVKINSNLSFSKIQNPLSFSIFATGVSWTTKDTIPPSGLSYPSSYVISLIGNTVSYTPTLTNSGVGSLTYTISPSITGGLSFNTSNGVISGTNSTTPNDTTYTVSVGNSNNFTSTYIRVKSAYAGGTITKGSQTTAQSETLIGYASVRRNNLNPAYSFGSISNSTFKLSGGGTQTVSGLYVYSGGGVYYVSLYVTGNQQGAGIFTYLDFGNYTYNILNEGYGGGSYWTQSTPLSTEFTWTVTASVYNDINTLTTITFAVY